MQGNRLKLNADKTHLMTVGTSRSLQRQEDSLTVYMDNCRLGESEDKCETLLGCQIEPGLKWHKQVSQLILKLKKRMTALEKMRIEPMTSDRSTIEPHPGWLATPPRFAPENAMAFERPSSKSCCTPPLPTKSNMQRVPQATA